MYKIIEIPDSLEFFESLVFENGMRYITFAVLQRKVKFNKLQLLMSSSHSLSFPFH